MTKEEAWRRTKGYLYDVLSGEEAIEIIEVLKQEPCPDCISRKTVIDTIKHSDIFSTWNETNNTVDIVTKVIDEAREQLTTDVNELPSVTPTPKTGRWISVNTGKQVYTKGGMTTESVKCSECDEWLTSSDEYSCYGNYCPNCGAKMESEE